MFMSENSDFYNLIKTYSDLTKRRNEYVIHEGPEILKRIRTIRKIVKSNHRLFSKLFKQKDIESLELTEIYNEESSFNGTLYVDLDGKLEINLNSFKKKKKIDVYIENWFDHSTSGNLLSLKHDITPDEEEVNTYNLKGFYADTPTEIQDKFCKNIKPIYKELLAGMSKHTKVDLSKK